jgi:hypothetical protein
MEKGSYYSTELLHIVSPNVDSMAFPILMNCAIEPKLVIKYKRSWTSWSLKELVQRMKLAYSIKKNIQNTRIHPHHTRKSVQKHPRLGSSTTIGLE